MTKSDIASKAEVLARRWANENHGSEGLWQMYLQDAYLEVAGLVRNPDEREESSSDDRQV